MASSNERRTFKEMMMKTMRRIMVAVALGTGLVTAAQAHPFIGVGIVGGPVFPVASAAQIAPPLPVYPQANASGPAPLPPEAQPVKYVEPAVANIAAILGHGNDAAAQLND
jgi:hypothetical protein